jgi:type II secretory ATPase GspE/PulE/Tfp pilus assembly ATPase PilB-like protein
MGIESFLMSSSTIGVVTQRLTRRLCPECKEPYTPDDLTLKYMSLQPDPTITFYRNKGCERCSYTGYRGRVGVYEVLRLNTQLRRLVAQGSTTEAIQEAAVQSGMRTLKDYSLWLLQNGSTTMEEILQVVSVRE